MNLDPFTGAGSTPARRRFWDQVVAYVNSSQKLVGRNVTVIEAQGMGTLINVTRERGGPAGPCCIGEWPSITCSLLSEADCIAAGGSFPGGTTCEGVDCNSGACCEVGGSCSDGPSFFCGDCVLGSSSCFQGYGTSCATTRCEGPCCIGCPHCDCECTENQTYDECQALAPGGCGAAWLLNGGACGGISVDSFCCQTFDLSCADDCRTYYNCCCEGTGVCTGVTSQAECDADCEPNAALPIIGPVSFCDLCDPNPCLME